MVINYESTATALVDRISALMPTHPEILRMDSAWDLFKVPGFKCDDLQPSLAQARAALSLAKHLATPTQQP
jgi:hypothetical protein